MTTTQQLSDPLESLAKGLWWVVVLRGVFAILLGIVALIAPGAALTGIAVVYAVYAIIDGVAAIGHAVRKRGTDRKWGWLLLQGVFSLLAGLIILVFPAAAGVVGGFFVLWMIVSLSLVHGVTGIVSAEGAANDERGRGWGIASAVVSVVFAVVLAVMLWTNPGATVLSLIWVVGLYAIAFGVMLVVTAVQLRRGPKSEIP
jgi:uncharacterized membrane protein HdeD (DUF308 family)